MQFYVLYHDSVYLTNAVTVIMVNVKTVTVKSIILAALTFIAARIMGLR